MKYKKTELQDPFSRAESSASGPLKVVVSGSNDFYGANSLETFSSASGLSLTHEDAQGFLDYPTSFPGKAANYWRKDAGVKVWAYEETFDNWQDTLGMDAVNVFYHSGHGNMDGNGVFQAPLGGLWDNRDWAFSNKMAFANEKLRYLFWSTCYSLRVSGSDNPVKTWWNPNKGGLRMLFGYETTSIDDASYGSKFWEEWKKGKTFARAFLDASWRISHNQVPVVMAVGANQAEAINRLNSERFFQQASVAKGWYQWQWVGTLPNRSFANKIIVPKDINSLILNNKFSDDATLSILASKLGMAKSKAETILLDQNGNRMLSLKELQMNVNAEGAINLHFGKANYQNKTLLSEDKAVKIAQRFLGDFELGAGVELKLGNIRHHFTCGGTLAGSGTLEAPSAVETIVQFRQTHRGVESINSDHGLITVNIDNDGRIVNVYDSTKMVLGEVDSRTLDSSSPTDPAKATKKSIETQFSKRVERMSGCDSNKASTLRESIGYDFSGKHGAVVHQKDIEVDYGNAIKKRYKVRVQLE